MMGRKQGIVTSPFPLQVPSKCSMPIEEQSDKKEKKKKIRRLNKYSSLSNTEILVKYVQH